MSKIKVLSKVAIVIYKNKFAKWMAENCAEDITDLLEYFSSIADIFPNLLWCKYSMVKKTLIMNNNGNIVITIS